MTNDAEPDEVQAYSAGVAEGILTHDLIYMHWFNTLGDFCNDKKDVCQRIDDFVQQNLEWVKGNVEKHANTVDYWHQV